MNKNAKILRTSGVALVLVLGFLVIISALAVAFFASVTTELRASRNFQSGVNTRQLQDSVVNLVEGQIRQATAVDPTDSTTFNRAWASQPGMIQTFGDGKGGASAQLLQCYKLYSSNAMTVPTPPSAANPDYVQAWDQSPALYTDLNSPIMVPDPADPTKSVPRFPIIDPRANDQDNPEATTTTAPIVTGNLVEGFHYPNVPNPPVNEMAYSAGGGDGARLPMPVRWIYVLKDGSLTVPSGPGTGKNSNVQASFSNSTFKPSKTNPIIGRVAFWTDDDTSKLNVNVAAGSSYVDANPPKGAAGEVYTRDEYAGSFWDTPRVNSNFDQGQVYQDQPTPSLGGTPRPHLGGLAAVQMRQNEFQRYPGHPATTSLSMVFQQVLTSEQLYQISPRIQSGNDTTRGGTNRIHIGNVGSKNGIIPNTELAIRYDRLYDSVDEMIFAPLAANATSFYRKLNSVSITGMNPQTYDSPSDVKSTSTFTPGLLDRLRFFITAYNRSPDLNLYGHPRISVWPVRSQGWTEDNTPAKSGINAFDSLTLFCSTIGPAMFNYPKNNSDVPSPTNGPYHYSFFRHEPAVSGTGSNVTITHSATSLFDVELPRNAQLFTYLQSQFAQDIPGFGGNFRAKYKADLNETLIEMFDYIRAANLWDTTNTIAGNPPLPNPVPFAPKGIVMPSAPTSGPLSNNLGMGRFPTICEATLVFYYAGSDVTWKAGSTLYPLGTVKGSPAPGQEIEQNVNGGSKELVIYPPLGAPDPLTQIPKIRYMAAALVLSTFNPMQGYGPVLTPGASDPKISYVVTGLSNLKVGGANIFGSNAASGTQTITLNNVSGDFWGGRNFGGFEGFQHTLAGGSYPLMTPVTDPNKTPNLIPIPVGPLRTTGAPSPNYDYREVTAPTFNLTSNGPITVEVDYGGQKLQTIDLNFPTQTGLLAPRGDDIIDAEPLTPPIPPATMPSLKFGTPLDSRSAYYGPLRRWYWSTTGSFDPNANRQVPGPTFPVPQKFTNKTRSLEDARDFQRRINWVVAGSSYDPEIPQGTTVPNNWYGSRWRQIVQPGDTVRSLVFCDQPSQTNGTKAGDLRLAAITPKIAQISNQTTPSQLGFYQHPDYTNTAQRQACTLRCADGSVYYDYAGDGYFNTHGADPDTGKIEFYKTNPYGNHVTLASPNQVSQGSAMANLTRQQSAPANTWINGVLRADNGFGDFDTGVGSYADGPFFNKQDEGNSTYAYVDPFTGVLTYPIPYFGNGSYQRPGSAFWSPNRQMPSAGMMGSLLSRATSQHGWETLCFCPNPAGVGHSGIDPTKGPLDHLLLDYFQMPIVQPYPISEPFSTAGRVNLNYQIQPFDYIQRDTALRAVLYSERVSIMNTNDPITFDTTQNPSLKTPPGAQMWQYYKGGNIIVENIRKTIDRHRTMDLIKNALATQGPNGTPSLFRSPSQICEIFLIPDYWSSNITTASQAATEWVNKGSLTGDNVREKPYTDIFPRLTTKSNTYTIHMRVQSLRQVGTSGDFSQWDESRDAVLGEYRGSSSIERYIDPSDRRFNPNDSLTKSNNDFFNPDTAIPGQIVPGPTNSLESMYRFRTVNTKLFAPY